MLGKYEVAQSLRSCSAMGGGTEDNTEIAEVKRKAFRKKDLSTADYSKIKGKRAREMG